MTKIHSVTEKNPKHSYNSEWERKSEKCQNETFTTGFFQTCSSKFWFEVYIDLPSKANLTESPTKIHPHLAQTVVPSCDQMIPSTLTLQNQNDYKKITILLG